MPYLIQAPHPPNDRYSALFEGEDPDIQLGDGSAANRKGSVSVTGSGHVRLKQKSTRDGPSGTDEWRDTDERGLWAGSSDGDEKKSRARRESPRKVGDISGPTHMRDRRFIFFS